MKEKSQHRPYPGRAFIFDMDGTLVDNMKYHSKAWLALFQRLGIHLKADEFLRRTAGKTNSEILYNILGKNLTEYEIQELSDQKETFYRELYRPHLKAIQGLISFLSKAVELGIPMAVATAAGQKNIEFILRGLQIEPFFKAIVGAEDIRNGKPDPEIFLKSAERLEVTPEACLVFEDSILGIEAAARAGMRAILIKTSYKPEELGYQPALWMTISNFTELDIHSLVNSM